MKKWLFLAIFFIPAVVYPAGMRSDPSVTPESRDEGDTPIFLDIKCDPSVWTVVTASDTIRRSMFIQSDYILTNPICLGTAPSGTTTIQCDNLFPGVLLGTAVPSYTSYTKNSWTCRTLGAVTIPTGYLHAVIGRDKRDYGSINSGSLQ